MIHRPDDTALFPRFTDEQLAWLSGYGRERTLEAGEYLFKEGDHVDSFYIVLEGEIRIFGVDSDGAEELVNTLLPGSFAGQLAVLTGKRTGARALAPVPSRVLEITADAFRRVATTNPEIADVFISTTARRMRRMQAWRRQNEKLAALGKLSAGLAHELTNPAAAARRAAEGLREAALQAQRRALEHDERFSPAQRASLAGLQYETAQNFGAALDPLAASDRENEVAEWLEKRGFEDPWVLAPILATAGLDTGRLGRLAEDLGDQDRNLAGALEWLGATLELVGLADEIEASTGRISELVRAVKEYTHMDRAAFRELDVREGLESTLTILGHKLKGVITVRREYEDGLPRVQAHGGELNQVWTNLLDNAADAAEGQISVSTHRDGDRVVVEIADDGPGIPREIQNRIFEPFFTTKEIGEGTGLGLDIVRRVVSAHGGEVSFDSKPGDTRFLVRLPARGRPEDPEGGE